MDIMYGSAAGSGRLNGMLPPGTGVVRETGIIGRIANEAGINELPHDPRHVVTMVYIKRRSACRPPRTSSR